jgi:ribosome-associated protein
MGRFEIPDDEIVWRFDTSGGPGGQHANRSNTRVELRFDVAASRAFDDELRARLVSKLGPEVRIIEARSRSQSTNRTRAIRRLHAQLETAAKPDAQPRRRTRPSRAAMERRLAAKRRRSRLKGERRPPVVDD